MTPREAAQPVLDAVQAALDKIDVTPRGTLTWTTERPTVPGRWWWARGKGWSGIVWVCGDGKSGLCVHSDTRDFVPLSDFTHFAGPIPEPQEPTA